MSLADNKRNVFTTIGSYTSFMQQTKLPKRTDLYSSINNKKDVVPFLLDTLKVVAGTDVLKELIGGMLTNFIDTAETGIKKTLKKQFTQTNSGDGLPIDFKTNGINLPIKNIDIKGKLKVNPNSDSGKLIYNTSKPNFDKVAHDAILNASNPISLGGGMNMDITYIETSDSFNIKPTAGISDNIGEYFSNFIDNTEIINKNELITNVMDVIYGTNSKKNEKTSEQVLEDLKVQKLLEQVLNNNDSFLILPQENDELIENSKAIANGVTYYDMGCGLMSVVLPFESLTNLVETISGSTDVFVVGNAVENTIYESTTNNPQTTAENKQTIKDGFFQKLINVFTIQISQFSITSPQIRVLLAIMSMFQNNGQTLISSVVDDMKDFSIFIKCLVNDILRMIGEYIFMLAVGYLVMLLTPVIKRVLKEKTNQYTNIIKSLTPASKIIYNTS